MSNASPTSPYYLNAPRIGDLYQWRGPAPFVYGEPSAPPIQAGFHVRSSHWDSPGNLVNVVREVQARFRDPVLGEVRKPVMIVPRIAVELKPNALLWPLGVRSREFVVALEHLANDSGDRHRVAAGAGRVDGECATQQVSFPVARENGPTSPSRGCGDRSR